MNKDLSTPTLKKVGEGTNNVLDVLVVDDSHFYPYWHYHPQYEIFLVEKGSGYRHVGDNISRFSEGDIIFLGSHIPHLFRNHPEYFDEKSRKRVRATVLYFSDEFANGDFFKTREAMAIGKLLRLAQRGLLILGPLKNIVARHIRMVAKGDGMQRLIDLIALLHLIATKCEFETLSSPGFTQSIDEQDFTRLNKTFDYLLGNFQNKITLAEVSKVANMSPASFCRYFKERTNKTLINFLNEIRIGQACKYLIENKNMNVSQICYKCGFNNLTNFNIQFKKLKKISPMVYRSMYNV